MIRAREAGGIDPVDGVSEKTWRDRFAGRLVAELEAKPAYSKIRVIGVDDNQREIVRVDRRGPNGAIRDRSGERLGQKATGPISSRRSSCRPGEIYVSPLELDRATARPS